MTDLIDPAAGNNSNSIESSDARVGKDSSEKRPYDSSDGVSREYIQSVVESVSIHEISISKLSLKE